MKISACSLLLCGGGEPLLLRDLHRAAQLEHLPDSELEALDEQAVSLTDRFRLHPPHERYIHGLAQAAREATAQGNVILVGRGSRQLVGESPEAFHLRLVAPRDWRSRRMAAIEDLPPERSAARCLQVDRARERFTRYFEVLRQLMTELAARGDVLLVGRGGSCFLRDHPHAFHVRLVAPSPIRLRRVMEYRWLAQTPAEKLIADSDEKRRRFYHDYFETDWSDPLGYDITVNSGRLGPTAVDFVALAAKRFWDRSDSP